MYKARPANVAAVSKFPIPKTVAGVHSFVRDWSRSGMAEL